MSVFRVGQRVKRVSEISPWCSANSTFMPLGAQGVVTDLRGDITWVRADGRPEAWGCYTNTLAPLTDPHADAFMERLKKLDREPINSPEKVTA